MKLPPKEGVGTEIFLQRGLDTPVNKRPDGQIT